MVLVRRSLGVDVDGVVRSGWCGVVVFVSEESAGGGEVMQELLPQALFEGALLVVWCCGCGGGQRGEGGGAREGLLVSIASSVLVAVVETVVRTAQCIAPKEPHRHMDILHRSPLPLPRRGVLSTAALLCGGFRIFARLLGMDVTIGGEIRVQPVEGGRHRGVVRVELGGAATEVEEGRGCGRGRVCARSTSTLKSQCMVMSARLCWSSHIKLYVFTISYTLT